MKSVYAFADVFLSKATNVAVRIYVYIYEILKCELKQSSHFKLLHVYY